MWTGEQDRGDGGDGVMTLDSSGPDQSIIRGRGGVVWRLRRLLVVHGSSLFAAPYHALSLP